ncbi:MAG: LytTR family DNA-binding domain-containing protein [Bacteroidales bacterium]|jgi:DNA-binding LytR/AlgR family response regulator|nr:LytTR family DNA-binding domain-containing protein [Bacteroidales bacterium]MCU0408461.1 LytTR family DNA-binding domain-containing protein [Bacteroidales bacterium]
MIIKCIAVDDEALALEKIRSFVEQIPALRLNAVFRNAEDALAFIRNNPVQLIFLDIQMDRMSGIEMLEKMIVKPQVILTTAYGEYALKGFDLSVTDFLLKPYTFDRFSLAVTKALEYLQWQQGEVMTSQPPAGYIFIKSGYKLVKIFVDDILYVEGMRDYQCIITKHEKIIASHSMTELERLLSGRLVRCHKSYLVALSGITSIEHDRIRVGSAHIPIGESYKEEFYRRI